MPPPPLKCAPPPLSDGPDLSPPARRGRPRGPQWHSRNSRAPRELFLREWWAHIHRSAPPSFCWGKKKKNDYEKNFEKEIRRGRSSHTGLIISVPSHVRALSHLRLLRFYPPPGQPRGRIGGARERTRGDDFWGSSFDFLFFAGGRRRTTELTELYVPPPVRRASHQIRRQSGPQCVIRWIREGIVNIVENIWCPRGEPWGPGLLRKLLLFFFLFLSFFSFFYYHRSEGSWKNQPRATCQRHVSRPPTLCHASFRCSSAPARANRPGRVALPLSRPSCPRSRRSFKLNCPRVTADADLQDLQELSIHLSPPLPRSHSLLRIVAAGPFSPIISFGALPLAAPRLPCPRHGRSFSSLPSIYRPTVDPPSRASLPPDTSLTGLVEQFRIIILVYVGFANLAWSSPSWRRLRTCVRR